MRQYESDNTVAGDLIWGALAGAAAVWAMDRVDQYMYDRVPASTRWQTVAARPGGLDPAHVIANKAAQAVGTELSPKQPHPAGIAVHYGLGAMMGALYSAFRLRTPFVGSGHGLVYGLAMFALQDEGLNAMMGTGGRPRDYPWQAHARGAVAHGAFGVATDTLLRLFRRG